MTVSSETPKPRTWKPTTAGILTIIAGVLNVIAGVVAAALGSIFGSFMGE